MLIDSETCVMAVNGKFDLVKQLSTVLQGEVKPMITQCCITELYLKGKEAQGAVDLAKQFERRKCNHREAIPGDDCLADVVGDSNKHRYVIVAQSQPLRNKLRAIPGVPLVHINRAVMVLEPPSDATLRKKALAEQKLLGASTSEMALIEGDQPEAKKFKKKGPKGPNPLSVKKKKTEEQPPKKKAEKPADEGKGRPPSSQETEEPNLGKRKRTDDDGDEVMGDGEAAADTHPQETQAQKRRRRRKRVAERAAATGGSTVDNDDDSD